MELKTFSSSSPESEFNDWFSETHNGTSPVWEMDDDVDVVDYDIMDDLDE